MGTESQEPARAGGWRGPEGGGQVRKAAERFVSRPVRLADERKLVREC